MRKRMTYGVSEVRVDENIIVRQAEAGLSWRERNDIKRQMLKAKKECYSSLAYHLPTAVMRSPHLTRDEINALHDAMRDMALEGISDGHIDAADWDLDLFVK